jgi:lysophospholipase L1-like esterase
VSWQRRLVFGLVTALGLVALAEGAARVAWVGLRWAAFSWTLARGQEMLRNDAIQFMKEPHPEYGYVLRPGFARGAAVINAQGFAQRSDVARERRPGVLRVMALGESTTQGHHVDTGNYPVYLRALLERGRQGAAAEVINAGVAGWTSDQIALRVERELADYRPDVAVLYVGWNDFQSYDPYSPPPRRPSLQTAYSTSRLLLEGSRLKSLALLSATWSALAGAAQASRVEPMGDRFPPQATYRFYLANLDRIVAAFQRTSPHTRVVICTLAGRWPEGTRAQFDLREGHVWWMKSRDLGPEQAAEALARFNELIREHARERALLLVDVAHAFESLDRERLFWDFAHLHFEGYELLAELIYDGLRQGGLIQDAPSPRRDALLEKYRRPARPAPAAAT